jgi:hypothetical protein
MCKDISWLRMFAAMVAANKAEFPYCWAAEICGKAGIGIIYG